MTRRSKRQAVQQEQQEQEEQEEQEEQQQEQQQQSPQDSTTGITQEEIASLDPAELSNPDAVINGIRFGLTKISKLAEETIPHCASDDKSSVADRLEACMITLIKAETMYSKAASIVTDMVENMPEETNSDAATILRTCEQISDVSKERIAEFSESLTEEEIKSSRTYKHFVNKLQKLLRGEAADSDILDEDDDDEDNEDDDDNMEGQDEDDEEEGEDEDDEEEGGDGGEVEENGGDNEEEDEDDDEEMEAPAVEAAEEGAEDDDDDDDEEEDNDNDNEEDEEEEDDDDEEGPAAAQMEEAAGEEDDGDEDNDDDNEDVEEGGEQSGSEDEEDEEEVAEPPQQAAEPEADEEEEEESEDEILEDEEQLLPTVDPITRQELKDPVRNQKCGHIYGKAAMAQLIKKNSKTRCPIAGCSNKEFIKLNQLVADRKLTMEIRKKQAEEKKQNRRR